MATNPFYVEPLGGADIGGTLVGIGGLMQRREQMQAQAAEREAEEARRVAQEQKTTQAKQSVAQAYRSGDPNQIAEAMVKYPEMQKALSASIGFRSEATKNNMLASARAILQKPDKAGDVLRSRIAFIDDRGGDSSDARAQLVQWEEDPEAFMKGTREIYAGLAPTQEWEAYAQRAGIGPKSKVFQPIQDPKTGKWGFPTIDPVTQRPAFVELPGITGRTEAEKMASELEKRQKIANIGLATETRKAEERARILAETEPSRAAAVERAVGTEKERQKSQITRKASAAALGAYDSAMTDLMSALDGTEPGALVGRISITDAQKKADAAETVASSALKDVFRKSGEGTFTDKDQEHLANLLPKRTEPTSVRKFKAQMLDDIVKRKVSGDSRSVEQIMAEMEEKRGRGAQPAAQALPPTNAQGWQLMTDATGNRAYVGPNGQVEEVP